MIYFVTGATGFLGGRVVELLLERGEEVIAFGRNSEELKRLKALGAQTVQADLTHRQALIDTMPEQSTVIHCAALSTPWGKESEFFKTNVLGTQLVAGVALEKNVSRFIHISTPSVYVENRSREGILESDPLPENMINDYARTKLQAEKVIDGMVEHGLPAITIRPQGIFGPRDTAILPRLIRVAEKGFIPVMNENVRIDLTYVDNVVEAIFCAIHAPQMCIGEKYNITNDEPVDQATTLEFLLHRLGYAVKRKSIRLELALKIARTLEWLYRTFPIQGEPLLTRYSVCTLAFTRTLNIEKAKRELGYRPRFSMKEGLERTILWFGPSRS
jgi:nucleoside-diphosphate-sugar epimerase